MPPNNTDGDYVAYKNNSAICNYDVGHCGDISSKVCTDYAGYAYTGGPGMVVISYP